MDNKHEKDFRSESFDEKRKQHKKHSPRTEFHKNSWRQHQLEAGKRRSSSNVEETDEKNESSEHKVKKESRDQKLKM